MIEKLKECFDEMVVYKDLKKSDFFSSLSLPSFLRDWLLKKFEDENGDFDVEEVSHFIHTYLPKKEEWLRIKNQIIYENEYVKILTKIAVDIDIKTGVVMFTLPDFGLTTRETIIENSVWSKHKHELVKGRDVWGIVELGYLPPEDSRDEKGKIKLVSFTDFCPYDVDLDYYKEVRSEFTIDEWIDVLLGAIDYNASGYENTQQKITMLTRLLPFLEKRLNLIELAPKGTGKSYIFGNISRQGILVDGGKVTRAKMFYDAMKQKPGFIEGHDYVAIDEVKLVSFGDANEMRSIMQGYMEKGTFNFSGFEGKSDAGVVFLGNIAQDHMDEYTNMFSELPEIFKESALVDRIHGFIKGWNIPRMNDDLKICGWALNSEYFSSILHLLRDDLSYRIIVDKLTDVPERADTRDTEAIKRIATAYLKLLFPNVKQIEDISTSIFEKYCLHPALKMRNIIKIQLGMLDKEFKGKNVPNISVKTYEEF